MRSCQGGGPCRRIAAPPPIAPSPIAATAADTTSASIRVSASTNTSRSPPAARAPALRVAAMCRCSTRTIRAPWRTATCAVASVEASSTTMGFAGWSGRGCRAVQRRERRAEQSRFVIGGHDERDRQRQAAPADMRPAGGGTGWVNASVSTAQAAPRLVERCRRSSAARGWCRAFHAAALAFECGDVFGDAFALRVLVVRIGAGTRAARRLPRFATPLGAGHVKSSMPATLPTGAGPWATCAPTMHPAPMIRRVSSPRPASPSSSRQEIRHCRRDCRPRRTGPAVACGTPPAGRAWDVRFASPPPPHRPPPPPPPSTPPTPPPPPPGAGCHDDGDGG